jgi:hypothetical protein
MKIPSLVNGSYGGEGGNREEFMKDVEVIVGMIKKKVRQGDVK